LSGGTETVAARRHVQGAGFVTHAQVSAAGVRQCSASDDCRRKPSSDLKSSHITNSNADSVEVTMGMQCRKPSHC
jgi:hypothetical protein